MEIVIMRHGEAENQAATDAQRNLTDRGRELVAVAGQRLSESGFTPDEVWVSPYVRAQQTCAGVMAYLPAVPVHTREWLEPESNPQLFIDQLATFQQERLLVVSHQPLVSTLVGMLAESDSRYGPPMSPASMALLQTEIAMPGCCDLLTMRHAPLFESGAA